MIALRSSGEGQRLQKDEAHIEDNSHSFLISLNFEFREASIVFFTHSFRNQLCFHPSTPKPGRLGRRSCLAFRCGFLRL